MKIFINKVLFGLRYNLKSSFIFYFLLFINCNLIDATEFDFETNLEFFQNPIRGKVVDENRNPISDITISIIGRDKKLSTDKNGNYEIHSYSTNEEILFTGVGYISQRFSIDQLTKENVVVLTKDENLIETVDVLKTTKTNISVDLKNKKHMSLGQLLEANVPGVTLKRNSSTNSVTTLIRASGSTQKFDQDAFDRGMANSTTASSLAVYTSMDVWIEEYKKVLNELESLTGAKGTTVFEDVVTSVDNGVSVEFNGASSFGGQTSGMLFVIDGFPTDNFPIDFPLSNIQSVEIIRDPQECLKWGIRGLGGVVLITSNTPQLGKVLISYSNTSNYINKPDISASSFRLANSAEYLDYYLESYRKGLTNVTDIKNETPNLTPAMSLLNQLDKKLITEEVFNSKWDSLSMINNRDQLEVLNESSFNQNHNLNLSGGSKLYKFALNLNYIDGKGSKGILSKKDYNIDLNNDFTISNSLKVGLLLKYSHSNNKSHFNLLNSSIEPYQLLFDDNGEYIYDYSFGINKYNNDLMTKIGYLDGGKNLVEDSYAKLSKTLLNSYNARLNLDWNISKNLQWNTTAQFNQRESDNSVIESQNSSTLRNLINNYGAKISYVNELGKNANSVYFLVPFGDLKNSRDFSDNSWVIRNVINYKKSFDVNHSIESSGAFILSSENADYNYSNMIYGYNSSTGLGLPVISNINSVYKNYYGTTINTSNGLTDPLSADWVKQLRTGILNGKFLYKYKNLLSSNLDLTTIALSRDGFDPNYTTTNLYRFSTTLNLKNLGLFDEKWIDKVLLTGKISRMEIADLPNNNIGATSSLLSNFENSKDIMFVTQYNQSQLSNQNVYNSSLKLSLGLFNNLLNIESSVNKPTNLPVEYNFTMNYFKELHGVVNSVDANLNIADINPYSSLEQMLNGAIGSASKNIIQNNFAQIPQHVKSRQITTGINLLQNRLSFGIYLYDRTNIAMQNVTYIPVDPTQGNNVNFIQTRLNNKGGNLNVKFNLFEDNIEKFNIGFNYILSYNKNKLLDVEKPRWRSGISSYLTAIRPGYDMSSIWSFEWAGLDENGDPQIYGLDGNKLVYTSDGDAELSNTNAVINFSGVTRAPLVNSLVPNISYKGFFASFSFIMNTGHVMRNYIPKMDGSKEQSIEIVNRWKSVEDSDKADVLPALSKFNSKRDAVSRYSSNSILPADHIRLREVQVGYTFSQGSLSKMHLRGLTLSAQLRNVALWTKNKYGIDPDVVTPMGIIVRPSLPMEASFSLNVQF